MQEDITPEEYSYWKNDKVTRRFFDQVMEHREAALKILANGHISSSARQNIMVGAINAYTNILEVRFEGENNDGTSKG